MTPEPYALVKKSSLLGQMLEEKRRVLPVLDVALLRKTMDHIVHHPSGWNQDDWAQPSSGADAFCGTAFCFAGWASVHAGDVPLGADSTVTGWNDFGRDFGYVASQPVEVDEWGVVQSSRGHIADLAEAHLGVTKREADALFFGENTIEELRSIVDTIIERYETVCASQVVDVVDDLSG